MNSQTSEIQSGISRLLRLFLIVLAVPVSGRTALDGAEIVSRHSDQTKLTGSIQEVSRKGIQLKTSKGEVMQISADDIRQILWEGEPVILRNARNADLSEKNDTALEGYRTALKEIPEDQKRNREEVEFGIGRCLARRCLARQGETDPSEAKEGLEQLTNFVKQSPESVHVLEAVLLTGDLSRLAKDVRGASEQYKVLKESMTGTYPLLGDLGMAQLALDRKDYPGAKKAFQAVLDSPIKGPLVARRQQQARIGLAEILIEAQSPAEALQLSDEVINSSSPEDSEILARGYLLRGKIHEQLGETKEALFDFLHVDLLFSQEKVVHAEALYRLASLWPALQYPERGLDARERLKGLYPDSEWAKK